MSAASSINHLPHEDLLAILRPLSEDFPNTDSETAEIARLTAVLTLPKGTIQVSSDIHGEDKKLRHVINNASGERHAAARWRLCLRRQVGGQE